MNSFSYLKLRLNELIEAVPYIRIRYSYEPEFQNHVVEIKPSEVYTYDIGFAEHESALCIDFSEKFPYESIIFISEEDDIKIDHPDFIFEGKKYNFTSSILFWLNIPSGEIIQSSDEGVPCKSSDYALAA